MNEDEFDYMEQMALDNYMEERALIVSVPVASWDALPTLSDFLGD